MKKSLRTYNVTIGCRDPQDNYVMKVKAYSAEEAAGKVSGQLNFSKHVDNVHLARPKKRKK